MKNKVWQAYQYIRYLIRSFHLHGIHSPFVFKLNERVIKEKAKYYAFEEIEAIRAKLLLTEKKIKVEDFGAGSQKDNSSKRNIKDIACYAAKKPRKAQLLFYLVYYLKPTSILELGTSLGISTSYLAKAAPQSNITTIEGSGEIAKVALINFKKLGLKNVNQVVGNFDNILEDELDKLGKIDFVYIDGNHRKDPTLHYFETCLKYAHDKSCLLFDDIYWSPEMTEAWNTIKADSRVSVTVDLFEFGIVFLKKDQAKENFTVYH